MQIDALFAGRPQPFGPRGAPSSIIKSAQNSLTVFTHGTVEDEQGNKKLHGGPEKVLHQFSLESYATLRSQYPNVNFVPGSIGENLTVAGMHDHNVYIGDVWQLGEVQVQVSAPRAPCNKISHRFGVKNLDRFVGGAGLTGWYYRVITTGQIAVGDTVRRLSRESSTVSVQALMRCVYNNTDTEAARRYARLDILDEEWREKCRRVASRQA